MPNFKNKYYSVAALHEVYTKKNVTTLDYTTYRFNSKYAKYM